MMVTMRKPFNSFGFTICYDTQRRCCEKFKDKIKKKAKIDPNVNFLQKLAFMEKNLNWKAFLEDLKAEENLINVRTAVEHFRYYVKMSIPG